MGDYLMLRWLETKRGFTIFVLFVLIAVVAGLFNLTSYKENPKHAPAVKKSMSQSGTGKLPAK